MKIIHYTSVKPTNFDNEQAKYVAGRVVIGKGDGADHFCMRIFEIEPGGHTPKHTHAWEHEIFVHSGEGEVYGDGKWHPIKPGTVLFVPANEEHQIRNAGKEILVFVCLIPSGAPEL
jgi:quercetin dioxygenase-like cupin family protein